MEIPVVIDSVSGDEYVARTGEPLPLSASGTSRKDALRNLEQAMRDRLKNGTTIASIQIADASESNPWVKFAGMFKDEPMFDEVTRIMAENRKAEDADPDFL